MARAGRFAATLGSTIRVSNVHYLFYDSVYSKLPVNWPWDEWPRLYRAIVMPLGRGIVNARE